MSTLRLGGEDLTVSLTKYADGNTACIVTDAFGLPYATLSVNFVPFSAALPEGAFYLKDYSENALLAATLVAQGFLAGVDAPPVQLAHGHVVTAFRLADLG